MSKIRAQDKKMGVNLINPQTLYNPTPFAYSHIAEVTQFSRIIHIAGQSGEDSSGKLSSDFHVQLKQTFKNIQLALDEVDCSIADIAVLKVLIVGHNRQKHELLIQESHRIWANLAFPTCTFIPVACLALPDMQIEIDATAYAL